MINQRIYRLFRSSEPAAPTRGMVMTLVLVACLATGVAVQRVRARHEVVRLGYELSKADEEVHALREKRRELELERATLTNPERIRALASGLGMQPVPPDQIRVVPGGHRVAQVAP